MSRISNTCEGFQTMVEGSNPEPWFSSVIKSSEVFGFLNFCNILSKKNKWLLILFWLPPIFIGSTFREIYFNYSEPNFYSFRRQTFFSFGFKQNDIFFNAWLTMNHVWNINSTCRVSARIQSRLSAWEWRGASNERLQTLGAETSNLGGLLQPGSIFEEIKTPFVNLRHLVHHD